MRHRRRVRAGHVTAELFGRAGGGVERGDQAATQHHHQRVRQADQLVEVGGDQQDPHPFGAGVLEQFPDRRLRADVDPRVGWAATSSRGAELISRPTISFCWLPPDRATASVSGLGARTS